MLKSNQSIIDTAIQLAPRLSVIGAANGQLTLDDVRKAICDARAFGENVPNFQSDRSLKLIEEFVSGM
jgi:hypothetical protein